MAAPSAASSLESALPIVQFSGVNTNKDTNLGGALNVVGAATFESTVTPTGAISPTGGVGPAGGFANTARTFHTGGVPATLASSGTEATPVTTETYYCEVFIPANVTLTGIAVFNGGAADGNVNVGLANSSGVLVAQSATTTAQSGTDNYQRIPFSATYAAKGPATYYVMTQHSTTTARFNTHVVGNFSAGKVTSQTYGTFTTLVPATTFTTALGPLATLY